MTDSDRALWLSGFGAATAWSLHLLTAVTVANVSCARSGELPRTSFPWWVLMALTLGAIGWAVWALADTMRRFRSDRPESGRVQFMAYGGILLNAMFVLALLFSVLPLFVRPLCS